MFTIKHIAANGFERLVECDSFVRERRSDGFIQYTACKPAPSDRRVDYVESWCGDERIERDLAGRQILYVMNRFGSTVSSHTFKQPDFNSCAGAEQGEPALAS